jgi:hypothetical protein
MLNPGCAPGRYLKGVRELLSTAVLGSPGGYPVFMRRWTRTGHVRNTRLEPMLLLGEEEAVIAAARAPGLDPALARRVWWALPTAEVARFLLENDAVAQSPFAHELAAWLIEYLPFEESPLQIIRSVRLLLRPGLISETQRAQLWQRGARRSPYHAGFIAAPPPSIPETEPARPLPPGAQAAVEELAAAGNAFAERLLWLRDEPGQTWLATLERVWRKPADQDVVVALLDATAEFFRPLRCTQAEIGNVEDLQSAARHWCACRDAPEQLAALVRHAGAARDAIAAMLTLAHAGEPLVRPIFARSDAVGTVMHRQIEPVVACLRRAIATLRGVTQTTDEKGV